jgi:hypothetical protein
MKPMKKSLAAMILLNVALATLAVSMAVFIVWFYSMEWLKSI